jgi:hypothetical protein
MPSLLEGSDRPFAFGQETTRTKLLGRGADLRPRTFSRGTFLPVPPPPRVSCGEGFVRSLGGDPSTSPNSVASIRYRTRPTGSARALARFWPIAAFGASEPFAVSPRALRWVACLNREAARERRSGERRVCKVDDKRVHKGCMALAIGRPSGSETRMMGLLGMVGRLERSGNKLVQGAAFRDQPLPNPIGGRRILTSFLPPTMIRL